MNSVRAVLSPLLSISYVFGVRIMEFSTGEPRLWCSFLYISLLWLTYYFLFYYTQIYSTIHGLYWQFYYWLNVTIALLSTVLGMYNNKVIIYYCCICQLQFLCQKYRTCLRQLDIVDDTLEKIGMTTDYQKLYKKTLLTVCGWFAFIMYTICSSTTWFKDYFSVSYSVYLCFMYYYSSYVNMLDDLLITSTLGYIELKFEQLNEYLRKLDGNNRQELKQAWEHCALLPCHIGYLKSTRSESATWIAIHLHLQLCKISRDLNAIFGLQITFKMGAYFTFTAIGFSELFNILFITNYNSKRILFIIFTISFLAFNIFRLFIINYICEKVSVKANATGDVISNIPYPDFNLTIRDNVTQFLLQATLTPLNFYGLGLFKFSLKFFYEFSSSVSTVIVILVQSHTEK